tara:strand:- start:74653 stop:75054 length:402 start_codon:yes stop_codon:yes gene_type:complete
MGAEQNKALVEKFFGHFDRFEMDEALAMLKDDATWRIMGTPEIFPFAAVHTKAGMANIWATLGQFMPNGMETKICGMIAEGNHVSVELVSHGTAADGRIYNNHYHDVFVIEDGAIVEVREYFDTQHVADMFLR